MTTWHAPEDVLARYAFRPEDVDDVTAMSVEAHLLACADCRTRLGSAVDPALLSQSWDAVADRIDRPRRTPAERFLHLLGVSEVNARLVGATRGLQVSWLLSVAGLVAAMVVIALQSGRAGFFLIVAPVIPVVAVAGVFAPGADPVGEAGAATPMSGWGLVLRRVLSVLCPTLVVLGLGAVALPGLSLAGAAWVLPALGLTLGALALGTWLRVEVAAATVATGWLVALWLARWYSSERTPVADLLPLTATGQLTALALAVLATGVLVARRDALAALGRTL